MLGLTLEELTDRVMSTLHGEVADPHVLAALHMLSGCGSSQAYLLFFCALPGIEPSTIHNTKEAIENVNFGRYFISITLKIMILVTLKGSQLDASAHSPIGALWDRNLPS